MEAEKIRRRQFYVLKPDETCQTSNWVEARLIALEWVRRGYAVEDIQTVVIEVTDETVQQVAA